MNLLSSLNPNVIIIAITVLVTVYAVVMGQGRVRLVVLSTFVGMVLASQLGSQAHMYLSSVPELYVRMSLLALPILLFGLIPAGGNGGHHERGSLLLNVVSGVLAALLIISAGLYVMPPNDVINITSSSLFATEINNFRLLILALAPLSLLLGTFLRPRDKHR